MKQCLLVAAAAVLLTLAAESSVNAQNEAHLSVDAAMPADSPEMWFYQQQLKRYDDPKTAVRRKAEFRAQQRQLRLATLKWYGFSNARPVASHTPFMGMYSPRWQGNYWRPFAWFSTGRPTVVVAGPQ